MNDCDEIKVASIMNKAYIYIYHFTSIYIELDKEGEDESLEMKQLSLLSHEIDAVKEATIYLNPKKFKELYNKDIPNTGEFIFKNPFIITIHVQDLSKCQGSGVGQVYYSISLRGNKLINSGKELTLNLEINHGDERFTLSKSKDKFLEYELFFNESK